MSPHSVPFEGDEHLDLWSDLRVWVRWDGEFGHSSSLTTAEVVAELEVHRRRCVNDVLKADRFLAAAREALGEATDG